MGGPRDGPPNPPALGAARRSRATPRSRAYLAPTQPAQRRQILQIGGRLGLLRCLEHLRHARKAWIVEQQAERTQAEPAAPDVLVAVEAGAERGAGVVQMEREHARQSHRARAALDGGGVTRGRADVVAGDEQVAGVQAHAHPLGAPHAPDDPRQVLERSPERVAPAGRVLEGHAHAGARRADQRLVHRPRHRVEAGLPPRAHVRAGVHDQTAETQRLGALQLVRERVDGLPPGRGHGRGQVDEVAAVREGVPDPRAAARGAERAGGGRVEGRRRPLALVLEEDLDGAAAEVAAPRRRQGKAARDRDGRAQLVDRPPHRPSLPPCAAGAGGGIMGTAQFPDETRRFPLEAQMEHMEPRPIPTTMTTMFEYDYATNEADLRRLYENAKRDQWNASKDIPWKEPGTADGRVIADELIDIYGSPLWQRLSEAERVELNRRIAAWRLSVLMHGEQGALLACSQLVDIVQDADAKFFQATQVVDEARHNEVLDRYITERLDNRKYPIPANARDVFDSILGESRWYVKTIGLQLVAETFAVALFKMMAESARDPVLEAVCRRILQDESRHMGFGMLALPAVVHGASPGERRELEDYTCFAVEKTLTGFFPREAYEDAGFSRAQIEEARRYRRDIAARNEYAPVRKVFKRDMHAAMVGNLARLGLLTERVRPRLEKLGVTLPTS